MSKSIYLINPANDYPSYYGFEVFAGWGGRPAVYIADLAITTIAGMLPEDFEVQLCDEHITPVDFNTSADYIGITGKVSQRNRMADIADEFRRKGKVVLIGGSYASLNPDALRPHCDVLVRGEVEEIFDEICDDLRTSCWKSEYVGDKSDLSKTAMPKWGKYPNDRARVGTLQTSRGCPFECEFCDVIQYLGRRQRHKPISLALAELDELYRHGYRSVFLADDNFTVFRSRAKELLLALRDWNNRQNKGRVDFSTQVSIDAAKDGELLRMCAEAGLTSVFIGIETPNEDSLKETKKHQNTKVDLAQQVQRFYDYGIQVIGGMIVGFDSDGLDIFKRQYEFAMLSSIPIFTLGALVAPESTPLHERMRESGRLKENGFETAGTPWATNIIPHQMTTDQLLEGMRWLYNTLYHPTALTERIFSFVDKLKPVPPSPGSMRYQAPPPVRSIEGDLMNLIVKLASLGPEEAKMCADVAELATKKGGIMPLLKSILAQYAQIRYMSEKGSFWDPKLAAEDPNKKLTQIKALNK
jgi:radical SAM superfamily enzyme YgiQ (UPF0313 family)